MTPLDSGLVDLVRADVTCRRPYPPNRHLTCVRVSGHQGQHVWVSDSERPVSSTVSWRDHAEECGCCYCTEADDRANAVAAAAAP